MSNIFVVRNDVNKKFFQHCVITSIKEAYALLSITMEDGWDLDEAINMLFTIKKQYQDNSSHYIVSDEIGNILSNWAYEGVASFKGIKALQDYNFDRRSDYLFSLAKKICATTNRTEVKENTRYFGPKVWWVNDAFIHDYVMRSF